MRLGRRDYWIRAIGYYVSLLVMLMFTMLSIYGVVESNIIAIVPMLFYAMAIGTFVLGIGHIVWMVQRFRDVGANPWLLLIHFIPFGWVGILIILLLPTGQMADGDEVEDVGSEY